MHKLYEAPILYLPATILWLIVCLYLIFVNKKTIRHIIIYTLLYAYVMMVFGVTLFPLPNHPLPYPPGHNFVPFNTIKELVTTLPTSIAIKQIIGNLIMFMPFGFLIPFFKKKKSFVSCIVFAIGFAILIEFLQFILGVTFVGAQYRSVDIDDVILNVVGAIIGYGIFKITPCFIKDPYLSIKPKS